MPYPLRPSYDLCLGRGGGGDDRFPRVQPSSKPHHRPRPRPHPNVYYVPIDEEDEPDEKTALMEAEMEAEMLDYAVNHRRRNAVVHLTGGTADQTDDEFWDRFEDPRRDVFTSSDEEAEDSSSDETFSDGTVRFGSRSPSPEASADCPSIYIRPATPAVEEPLPSSKSGIDRCMLSPTWNRTFPEAFIPRPTSTRTTVRAPRKRVPHSPFSDDPPFYPQPPTSTRPTASPSPDAASLPPIKLRLPPLGRKASNFLPPPIERTWSSAILPGMECWSPTHGGGAGCDGGCDGGEGGGNGGWPTEWEWEGLEPREIKLPEIKNMPAGLVGQETLPSMKLSEEEGRMEE